MGGFNTDRAFPRRGWVADYVDVLDEPSGVCDCCGKQGIRFHHVLVHERTGEDIRVGCVCAEALTQDYNRPRELERQARNEVSRKKRRKEREFAKGWQESVENGRLFFRQAGYTISQIWSGSDQFRVRRPEGSFAPATMPLDHAMAVIRRSVIGV